MAPVWSGPPGDHRAQVTGSVGWQALGRFRAFGYEVRCWLSGVIPDLGEAVGGPQRLPTDARHLRDLLALTAQFPACTWGRDEQGAGEMWNSNSLVSWLLVRSGHDVDFVALPAQGRAPGWDAGLIVAGQHQGNGLPTVRVRRGPTSHHVTSVGPGAAHQPTRR
jgi:hypothetical protein